MGSDAANVLALRTVVVTTRAAVRSHLRAGHADLARESAARGLLLLEDVAASRNLRDGESESLAEGRRELRELAAFSEPGEAP